MELSRSQGPILVGQQLTVLLLGGEEAEAQAVALPPASTLGQHWEAGENQEAQQEGFHWEQLGWPWGHWQGGRHCVN